MERLVAPRRGVLVQLPIRGTATAAEVDAASQKVVLAAATGQITPEDAETMSRMLEGRARLI
ncbi:MAG: hypothetical protein M3Y27_26605, partial [Acidobacteriota bacterium]|nr:hypothetical protein [Acidobacteriota bacterium]